MRRRFALIMVAIMLMTLLPESVYTGAGAIDTVTVDSFKYTIKADDDKSTAVLAGYTGSDTAITIPSSVNGVDVVGIGARALDGYSSLTDIAIPSSIKYIDDFAFSDCTGLKKVTIPANVERVGTQIFDGCTALESVEFAVGSKVTSISYFGDDLAALKNIKLPESLTYISTGSFLGYSIEHIDIPATVTYIGDRTFENCAYLEELVLPDNMTSVCFGLAKNCISLKKLVIGAHTVDIEEDAFYNCTSLSDFTYGQEIQVIEKRAFYNCENITSFVAPEDLQNIKRQAFYGCKKLGNIVLNEGLGAIGAYAFQKNYAVESIEVPKTVYSVGLGAFANNQKLTDMKFYPTYRGSGNNIFASNTHETNLKYAKLCTVHVYSNSQFLDDIKESDCKVEKMSAKATKSVTLYRNDKKVGSYITMKHGDVVDLTAKLTSGSTESVKWTTSDSAMGYVDQKGRIRTVRGGVCQITVTTMKGYQDYVTVIIDDSAHTGKKMAAVLVNNYVEKTQSSKAFNVKAKSYPSGKSIKYYSGNESVADIDKTGKVTIAGSGGVKLYMYTAETSKYEQGLGNMTLVVYPDMPKVTSCSSNAKGTMNVTWSTKPTAGYEVRYWLKGATTGHKSFIVTKKTQKSAKITGLTSGKNYSMKMRSYMVYKGKEYYTEWTDTYYVKIK